MRPDANVDAGFAKKHIPVYPAGHPPACQNAPQIRMASCLRLQVFMGGGMRTRGMRFFEILRMIGEALDGTGGGE
jgi:hypothetical protein